MRDILNILEHVFPDEQRCTYIYNIYICEYLCTCNKLVSKNWIKLYIFLHNMIFSPSPILGFFSHCKYFSTANLPNAAEKPIKSYCWTQVVSHFDMVNGATCPH